MLWFKKVVYSISFSPPTSKSSVIVVLPFFVKAVWLSLHIRFVNTGSVLPPTSTWLHNAWGRASARRAFGVKKYVYVIYIFRKWLIVLLDKTLIPRLGLCRALWSCTETAICMQPVGHHWSPLYGEKSWNVFLKKLYLFLTEERKTWISWMTWGWVNYQEFFSSGSELLF